MRTDLSVPLVLLAKRKVAPRLAPPFLHGPRAFILHYVRARPVHFAAVGEQVPCAFHHNQPRLRHQPVQQIVPVARAEPVLAAHEHERRSTIRSQGRLLAGPRC